MKKIGERRFEVVVRVIEEWIARGYYTEGERLPAERTLAATLQVSRNSIREAFLVLEQKDMIDIRRGINGGAYIIAPSKITLAEDIDILLRLGRITLDQVAEFRESIEWSVTSLAAKKVGADDIKHLKNLLGRAETYVERGSGWDGEFIRIDKEIHLCIARISDNPLAFQALEATLNATKYFERFLHLGTSLMQENLVDLKGIVGALENHQAEVACSLTKNHISRFNGAIVQ